MCQDQKIVKDGRGQEQPADKKRAQQNTAVEGGAAYAPNNQDGTVPPRTDDKGHGLTGEDKRDGSLTDTSASRPTRLPEGLRRDRTHPLSPTKGRGE